MGIQHRAHDTSKPHELFNRLADRDMGNDARSATQIRWTQYDGNELDPHTGAALSSNNHTLKLRNTAGKHVAVLLSATSPTATPTLANSILLIEDTGLSLGAGKALRLYDTAGVDYVDLASDPDGSLVLSGSGANSGRLTINTTDTSATIRTMVALSEAGVGKVRLGLTATDLFAIIDPTGAAAVLTVDATTGGTAIAGSLLVGGPTALAGALTLSGVISPAQIVANTENYNPTGLATARVIRVTTDAARNLGGIVAPAGPVGQVVTLRNFGSFGLVLLHESAGSTAANRMNLPNSVAMTLTSHAAVDLWYDVASTRWAPLNGGPG